MFTGLIEGLGAVSASIETTAGWRITIATPLGAELGVGDSIAVSGVCLTVVDRDASAFAADVSPETLRVTTLGALAPGQQVNLERSLRADARLGGHFVLGHVDAVADVLAWRPEGESWWLEVALPTELRAWVVTKGSIAVDGISLTVAALGTDRFGAQIIPHTRAATTLADRCPGDRVNLEADIIGKYAARLAELSRATPGR